MKPSQQADAIVSADEFIGATIGDFRILRKLGQGGMGQVFLAEQISLKRNVAIKMLRDEVAANATALTRFQIEAKTIAKLNHPNVVQAYLVGEHESRWFLAMEYVEGVSLREYMERNAPLEVRLVLSIMRQVASAFERAGELGIVHRDIKPENILITRKALVKVADFGLARCRATEERIDLTRAGAAVGTPLYMSPEQIEGRELDGRSDIYSFGVTCYQMLSGTLPFTGSNVFEVATKHLRDEPPDLSTMSKDVPAPLCAVIHKMLAKNPDDRYASARELAQDVAKVKQALSGATQTMTLAVDTPLDPPPAAKTSAKAPAKDIEDAPSDTRKSTKSTKSARSSRSASASKAASKGPIILLAVLGGAAVLMTFVGVLVLGVVLMWWDASPPERSPQVAAPEPAEHKDHAKEAALAALKQSVELHLKDTSPKPGGVEDCVDLAVHYLQNDKTAEAEALFKRMCERKPPSAYYFTGRLGLAVTDALNHDQRAAKAKLTELFESKAKDQRVQILKDIQAKRPDFAEWVNETTAWVNAADAPIAGKGGPTAPPKMFRSPGKMPFRK